MLYPSQLLTATVCVVVSTFNGSKNTRQPHRDHTRHINTGLILMLLDVEVSWRRISTHWNLKHPEVNTFLKCSAYPKTASPFSPGLCELFLLPQPPGGPRPRKQGKGSYPFIYELTIYMTHVVVLHRILSRPRRKILLALSVRDPRLVSELRCRLGITRGLLSSLAGLLQQRGIILKRNSADGPWWIKTMRLLFLLNKVVNCRIQPTTTRT